MSMRSYGEIAGVGFSNQGFDVYNLAYQYKLFSMYETRIVFVCDMTELKDEIRKLASEEN